ncbi:MAG TPA: DUF5916 domain-containing protein [Bacteroidia bacterium]|nr:DUF5916 domain-containing protein [Bacteroidia bacterium]
MRYCYFYLFLFFLLLWNVVSYAQEPTYRPVRIGQEISFDGKLDEPEWNQAESIEDFMQEDPFAGAIPTERTQCYMLYTDEYLFVGVRAFDHDPSAILRYGLERDYDINKDDGVAFVIDTYNDKSSGLIFVTNTLGARWDEEFTSDGGNENENYNTFWDAKSNVDSLGYTVEFRIPFSSLRFQSKDTVTMGFRFVRLIKRKNEYLIYPKCDVKISSPYFKVSLGREMQFTGLKTHKPFYIIPYAIAGFAQSSQLTTAGDRYETVNEWIPRKHFTSNETLDKIISNIGTDVKYGLSKNFTLDFTVNTDFAQAEVDNRIINLSKYEVNLPEKRGFFLESRNYLGYSFGSGAQMFISRSIGRENNQVVPIITGARVTGKSHGWQMGFLEMQTKAIKDAGIDPHNFFVFRTRKDIDKLGSFVGGIVTNRYNTNSGQESGQTIGWDVVKFINRQVVLVGGMVGTFESLKFSPSNTNFWTTPMHYEIAIFRNAREGWFYNLQQDYIGEKFRPLMGFIYENDLWNTNAGIGKQYNAGSASKIQYVSVSLNSNFKAKAISGITETRYIDAKSVITWKSGAELSIIPYSYQEDRIFDSFELGKDITIEPGLYRMITSSFNLTGPTKSNVKSSIGVTAGKFYSGDRISVTPSLLYNFSSHLLAGIDYEFNHIQFPESFSFYRDGLFETNLVRLNVSYYFSPKFSVKLFTQYEDISNEISSNLRVRYNPQEGTDLYVVFNQGLNTDRNIYQPHKELIQEQAVTVKFIRTIGL